MLTETSWERWAEYGSGSGNAPRRQGALAVRDLVLRALLAALGGAWALGCGSELAETSLAAGLLALKAGAAERYAAATVARTARRQFAAWVGPAALREDARKAGDAVQAATSAAASLGMGDLPEAQRLARNALRFAAEAAGEEGEEV